MRKISLTFFLLLMGMVVFAQSGVMRELSGTVELKLPGTSAFVPAKTGDRVTQDTVVSTGFKSTALVEVGSTVITVRPLTRLTLTEIRASSGTETLNLNLQAGRVRVDVNPPAGTKTAMSISSPMATASVRGTSFEFDTRNIHVNHGTVSFHGSKGSLRLVNTGSNGTINDNGKAEDPIVTRNRRFRPKPPVGSDLTGGELGGSNTDSSGAIIIHLNYGDDTP